MGQSHPRRCNVAVIGYYGSGKSSFINSMKELRSDVDIKRIEVDDDEAEVVDERGVDDNLGHRKQILFWEFPAAKMYQSDGIYALEKTIFRTDPVCFLYKGRLSESDMQLLTYLHKLCRNLIIVRTGVDEDVCNYERSHPQSYKQKDILAILQSYMYWHQCILEETVRSKKEIDMFLVSNYERGLYDQIKLHDKLVTCCTSSLTKSVQFLRHEIRQALWYTFFNTRRSKSWKCNGPAATCREELIEAAKKAKNFYSSKGIVGLHEYFKEELETLKSVGINVAVTGSSGTGKSSFINAVRDLTADDKGAAEVGVVETTMEPNSFIHPVRKDLNLWDLPGIGTMKVPKDSYLRNIKFEKYDFAIIISKCRITENEVWLAQELNSMKMRLAIVRTHIENDVKNGRMQNQKRNDVITRIRSNCEEELRKADLPFIPVFLIDNFEKNAYPDFARLEQYMLNECSLHRKEMLISCISDLTQGVIGSKANHLTTRIPSICDKIANIDSYTNQNSYLRHELDEFKIHFYLDSNSLKIDAMYTDFSDEDKQDVLKILDQDPPEIIQLVDALTSSTRGIPIYGKYKIRQACNIFLTSALKKFAKTSVKTTNTMVRGMKILQD